VTLRTWPSTAPLLSNSVIRVRVEIMGSQKCRNVGKSQSVHIMINPIISTRTRKNRSCLGGTQVSTSD
jgi:hypothetical protein